MPLESLAAEARSGVSVRRRTRKTTVLAILTAFITVIAAVSAGVYYLNRPVTLRIAVGPPNSDDVKVVQSIARVFDPKAMGRDRSTIRLRLVQTDGSVQSAVAVEAGQADLAVVRGDLKLPRDTQALATLRKNVVTIWAPAPAGTAAAKNGRKPATAKITQIENLAGHRIGVIGRSQSNVNLLRTILQQYGVALENVEIIQLAPNDVGEVIRNNKADAFLSVGPPNSKITMEAIAATARDGATPTFLAIESADAIANNFPVYEATEIAPGAFGGAPAWPAESIKTIGFAHHIVGRKTLSEQTAATFTRQLFFLRQQLIAENPLAAKIEVPDTDKDAAIPVHPGAAAYVDGEERTFMDRYSDLIWWSILGVSALSSLGAWAASYLRKDERVINTSLRERLMEMISEARQARTHDDLDAMQNEADRILRETLDCFERGGIETGPLTAFQIALEQFHNAVADRRLFLATEPAAPVQSRPRPAVA